MIDFRREQDKLLYLFVCGVSNKSPADIVMSIYCSKGSVNYVTNNPKQNWLVMISSLICGVID